MMFKTPYGNRISARKLIIELRGYPTQCDFCGQPKPENQLHPEEAGRWICIDCINADPGAYYGKFKLSE